ncbi:4-carboxy-4-hydroxy-2-oxoadipate aldolase/oxaloacetate decarboxylase [Neobacillus sp. MM2021_6]|uniref:4-carboxy-4-hydroxy-2-oxoadipate aldolase/oxaloacetate decarboxylase n=1 Tax=Bacillaceae TaxID=186817 RepID=UPI0014082455|nr:MULTISPECIES: 4-carboxy-4-hydroxy-2-oxoadipate aldolase/oxaloacetate decarboxylase [Bacillaceae]MBO0960000.1 4-carboxy-4-hydroxy-2-oxoadipate aldolase/oxaloacetate decarboxylase [Neobacillus sp. MM2021_6]NHC18678.1 4-carboxy-4-hydroxy-2-oxoadipate aldolase/oxaloacetate decarboxylase [Bacillus sp. MM2020_4]
MNPYIVKNFERPSSQIIHKFKEFDVSTVYEAQGKKGLMEYGLMPLLNGKMICGPAVTVVCHAGDNLMIHAALEVCQPGDVLVITTIGESVSGMIGELMVRAMIEQGIQGVIINAGIRDAEQIRGLGFPIWSKVIYSEGTTKIKGGWVNSPAVCRGIVVLPGDLIMADDDGVVVVKRADLTTVSHLSEKRVLDEEISRNRIANGELTVDIFHLRSELIKENVGYFDNQAEAEIEMKKIGL